MPKTQTLKIEIAVAGGDWPPKAALRALARKALASAAAVLEAEGRPGAGEVSLLFTDDAAMRALNAQWRGIDKPTNVLSFPAGAPPGPEQTPPLGDIALAAETVRREAALAETSIEGHITHLIVHGFFHLLGYDHQEDEEAEVMEALERAALGRIGFPDPYAVARRR